MVPTCVLICDQNLCDICSTFVKAGPPFGLSYDTFQILHFPAMLNVFVKIEKKYIFYGRFPPAIRRDFEIKAKLGDSAAKIANLPNGAKSSSPFGPDNVQKQLWLKKSAIVNLNQIQLEIPREMLGPDNVSERLWVKKVQKCWR